mmetsp:Transcript_7448/g.15191  ORF Transcript_7448/g.15191 Transcript_7448/m.15191 type:complete len:126 (-) Transcript_7448:116-493(-)
MRFVIEEYIRLVDPVFGTDEVWHRVLILLEILFYIPYCVATLVALFRGVENCEWIRVPTVMITTMIVESYVMIIGHNVIGALIGKIHHPAPILLVFIYLPFLVLPVSWTFRVFRDNSKVKVWKTA